ncbi:prepilin-type N-terminal cleavage/methylation domain-containing protein [Clostridium sp.]|uniref:type IV pilus modification PilV family protein n=1 Tax=Clostridium sp. TaxID=1506 RepID=UPI0032165F3F
MSARKNKGYTLLEAIIAMFILTTFSIVILTFQGVSMESKVKEKEIMEGLFIVESMRNILLCNLSYDELKSRFVGKTSFVNKDNIENGIIFTNDILYLVEEYGEYDYPVIVIEAYEEIESQVMKIELNYKYGGGKEMSNVFYKGNYEKN